MRFYNQAHEHYCGIDLHVKTMHVCILDATGRPLKVVKFATDVTVQKLKTADSDGQIAAIGKSQAVIEFDMDGTIRCQSQAAATPAKPPPITSTVIRRPPSQCPSPQPSQHSRPRASQCCTRQAQAPQTVARWDARCRALPGCWPT